ncbi:hypothetical protein ACLIX5_004460 [Salmonella enterica subsp. enterica serovar Bredeney]
MANIDNLSRAGRKPGALNKATVERTEALREWFVLNNFHYKILNEILDRLENTPKMVKTAELIKAFTLVQPYMFKTITEEETTERLDQILGSGNPAQMKAEILDFVAAMKVV